MMRAEQQVARNFLALGGGEAFSRLITFAATVYLARALGVDAYGLIALAANITLYFAKIADFGAETVGTHEVARHSGDLPHLIGAVIGARLALTVVLIIVSIGIVSLALADPTRTVLSLYFLTLLPVAASTRWVHMGRENARPIGIARVLGETLSLVVVVAAVQGPHDLWLVPTAQLIQETLVAAVLYGLLFNAGLAFRVAWNPAAVLPVARRAVPIVVQLLIGLVLYNSALVFLRLMRDASSVGFYAAAYSLISFLANLGIAYGLSLLPTITRLGAGTNSERALYHTALAQIFALGFPVVVGGHFLAHRIIDVVFGAAYVAAGPLLQILVWAIPLSTFRNVPRAALVARGHERLVLRATVYAVVANLVLNLTLIHFFGATGAAVSTVLTESLSGVLMLYYAARQGLEFPPLRRLGKPAVAALVMAAVLALVASRPIAVQIPLGVAAYGMALTLLGGVRLRRGALPLLEV